MMMNKNIFIINNLPKRDARRVPQLIKLNKMLYVNHRYKIYPLPYSKLFLLFLCHRIIAIVNNNISPTMIPRYLQERLNLILGYSTKRKSRQRLHPLQFKCHENFLKESITIIWFSRDESRVPYPRHIRNLYKMSIREMKLKGIPPFFLENCFSQNLSPSSS